MNSKPKKKKMGDFTDLVCIGTIFSPTYNGIRFLFSALYFMSDLFACFFPLEIGLQDFFSEITHNPLKSQMVGP